MVAALILYAVSISFPFLSMERAGLKNEISVIDAVGVLWINDMRLLALAAGLFILLFPLARIALLLAVTGSLRMGWGKAGWRARAFKIAQDLEPWAMAEVFLIGVIVSLVKVGELADVRVGPAFWAMACLVLVSTYATTVLCRDTIWQTVQEGR